MKSKLYHYSHIIIYKVVRFLRTYFFTVCVCVDVCMSMKKGVKTCFYDVADDQRTFQICYITFTVPS